MNKSKYLLILVFILIISIGAVSANEINSNSTDSYLSKNIDIEEATDVVYISSEHTISSSNYNDYFDANGNIRESKIVDGDTVKLSGQFDNRNFIISKKLTVIGINGIKINNGTVSVESSASGSKILNLNIVNNKNDLIGIFLKASNCLIDGNNISTKGVGAFPMAVNPGSQYNNITHNTFRASGGLQYEGSSKSTVAFVMGGSDHNYIASNYLESDDANGIYFSTFGSGQFSGGKCDYNVVFNNTLKCMVTPTSWAYGIQLMGSNNQVLNNTVIGYYRGISVGDNSIVRSNKIINLTGRDYNNMDSVVGGDFGISAGSSAIVESNVLDNCLLVGAGIITGSDSSISKNNIDVKGTGYGINANGDNVDVANNEVRTVSGACIYQAGKFSDLVVDNNKLVSTSGIGILVKKSSNTKYPSEVTITNNNITTSNEYAIDATEADKNSFNIKNNNVGNSRILSPSGEILPDNAYDFNGTVHEVTPDNFHSFFDENGNIINYDVKDGDILNFVGDFENLNMIISRSIKLTGSNPTFKNVKINVTSGGVWIENFTINNVNSSAINQWGIYASNIENLMIVNNNISVTDKNAAYAIYLFSVSKATVENNILYSSGDYLTYTFLGYGLENSIIRNNVIMTNGTGQLHGYEPTKCIDGVHSVNEIYRTYGILLLYSSGNQIVGNDVKVTSKVTNPQAKINGDLSTNSLVGIDIYFDSDNNVVSDNMITINANDNYIYGMGVLGAETGSGTSFSKNNTFANNIIDIKAHNFASGIISGYHSEMTNIVDNEININSDVSAYGITLEYAQNSKVNNNTVNLNADVCYLIEGFEANNNEIMGNDLTGTGSYVYGFAGYSVNNNIISKNRIKANGNGLKPSSAVGHVDVMGIGNAGIILKGSSSRNQITNNSIVSMKDYAADLSGTSGNIVEDNYIKGETTSGNNGVLGKQNNVVENNYGNTFDNSVVYNVTATYNGFVTLTADSGIADDNTVVYFYIDGKLVGSAKTVKGKATLKVRLNETYVPGKSVIEAKFVRDNYYSETLNAELTILKAPVTITVKDVQGKKGTYVLIEAVVKDSFGNPIEGMEVEFYRDSTYIGKGVSDANGIVKFVYKIPTSLSGNSAKISAVAGENGLYLSGTADATLKFTEFIQTIIVSNDIVMYYKNGTRLAIKLTDANGNPIANKVISITINGVTYTRTTDANGYVDMAINLIAGQYSILVKFAGDSQYAESSKTVSVNVLGIISGNDIVKYFRNDTQYSVKILDKNGNPAAYKEVTFNINGVFYKRTTDANGIATLKINLNPNEYIITTYYGDATYSNTIKVLPTMKANDLTKKYGSDGSFDVTVLNAEGKPFANQMVTFNINGVFYNRVTDSNGIAKLNIRLIPGNYIITSMYNGLSISNKVTVTN